MKELHEALDSISGLMAKAHRAFSPVTLADKPVEQQVFLVTYASLYYNLSAAVTILRNADYSSLPLILRTSLELFSDIVNIEKYQGYSERLLYNIDRKQIKFLNDIISIGRGSKATKEKIANIESGMNKYNEQNRKPITKKEKFELSGHIEYYSAVYQTFSGHVHNDFYFILPADVDNNSSFFDIYAANERIQLMLPGYIMLMFDMLSGATKIFHKYIGMCDEPAYGSFEVELADLQKYFAAMAKRVSVK